MRKLIYHGKTTLYQSPLGSYWSSIDAATKPYVVLCRKIHEIVDLISLGIENVVCIKTAENLEQFISKHDGKRLIIFVLGENSKDVLAGRIDGYKPIVYGGNRINNHNYIKELVENAITSVKKDSQRRKKIVEKIQAEDWDVDESELEDST